VAPHLSVVVPAYNEAQRIGSTLARIREYFQAQSYPVELIVVDDGSRDETVAVAREALAGFPRGEVISYKPNRGKGHAVRTGIVATAGDYVLFTDADLSTPIEEVERAFRLLEEGGVDMVLGSRAAGTTVVRKQPLYRRLAARFFNLVRDAIVPTTGIADTQCGFKLFRGEMARDVFRRQRVDRFMFDVETVYLASRLGYRYAEMPVAWADVPGSKVRVVRGALELLPELLSIRLRHGRLTAANRGT
jgi:dolichyl-phosphate beta-glucosyltransferase